MTKTPEKITLDFSGTDPEAKGPINWPHHREAITSRPLLLHGVACQTHHAGQTRLTVTPSHGRRNAVVAALRRITSFFQTLVRSAEQLSAEDRWRRILAEALKKYFRGRQPGCQPWLPPPRIALAG